MQTDDIRRFRRALRRFARLTAAELKKCCKAVTFAQCLVLLETEEIGCPGMSELAGELRLDNSTLSRTVDGLVAKALVERVHDDRDRRTVRIQLTHDGKRVCRAIHKDNDACYRRVFDKIPEKKQQALIRNFETLVAAFLDCEAE